MSSGRARIGLLITLVVAGIALAGAAAVPSLASKPATTAPIALALGTPYDHALHFGSRVDIALGNALRGTSPSVELLAVGAAGTVVGQSVKSPSPSDRLAGDTTMLVPMVSAKPSYWVALAPLGGQPSLHLLVTPSGPRTPGTPLMAEVTDVPANTTVYLLGVYTGTAGTEVASYVPPSACSPDPAPSGMVICNFRTPAGYLTRNVAFSAHALESNLNSLPVDNLPEAPLAAALPLAALPAVYLLMRRRPAATR